MGMGFVPAASTGGEAARSITQISLRKLVTKPSERSGRISQSPKQISARGMVTDPSATSVSASKTITLLCPLSVTRVSVRAGPA
jgi:hypothetical protein